MCVATHTLAGEKIPEKTQISYTLISSFLYFQGNEWKKKQLATDHTPLKPAFISLFSCHLRAVYQAINTTLAYHHLITVTCQHTAAYLNIQQTWSDIITRLPSMSCLWPPDECELAAPRKLCQSKATC